MKYRFALIFLLSLSLSSCSLKVGGDDDDDSPQPETESGDCSFADKLISAYSKSVAQTDGMMILGSGSDTVDDIQKIRVYYLIEQNCDVNEARALFVRKTLQLLKLINRDTTLMSYLQNHPFKIENLEFSICFITPEGFDVKYPFVNRVWSHKNETVFTQYDPEGFIINPSMCEPYKDSVKIARESGLSGEDLNFSLSNKVNYNVYKNKAENEKRARRWLCESRRMDNEVTK